MKKIYGLLLSFVMLSAFTACTSEVDDVFDQSSAERISDAISNDTELLTSASGGWLMKFYADTLYGGYNVRCKFNADNTVSVQNEMYGDTIVSSHYTLAQSEGVVLSFDTYNELIHVFSDPDRSVSGFGNNGEGMNGDFEFRVISACADSIVLLGKKHESRIVMTPLSSDSQWSDYISDVKRIESKVNSFGSYNLVVGSDTVKVSRKYHKFYFVNPENGNTINMSYIFTDKGMQLYHPVSYAGKIISGFTYSDDGEWQCFDDSNVKLCPHFSLASMLTNYTWYFQRSGLTDTSKWDTWINALYGDFATYYGEVSFLCFTNMDSGFSFYCEFGIYEGYLTYNVTEVSENVVTIQPTGTGDENGLFLSQNCYWSYITAPFSNKTFIISVDSMTKPTVMTLTQRNNPKNVITLTTSKKTDPFNN